MKKFFKLLFDLKKKSLFFIGFFVFSFLASSLRAEPLKDFLVSSAYGTVAGALIGVASLTFTDDPGSKMNNIARGASLGLYAGMGFGLYLVYGNPNSTANTYQSKPSPGPYVWLVPQWNQGRIDGGQLQAAVLRF